jgi:hypothetical protein
MTLNDQLTMTSISIVDCLAKADSKSLDKHHYRQLIGTLVGVCNVQASTTDYEPRTTFSTQYQSAFNEAAANLLAFSNGLSEDEFLKYIEKVHLICEEDERICDAFTNFYGPFVSRQDQLDATELEFGTNAKKLMKSILNIK